MKGADRQLLRNRLVRDCVSPDTLREWYWGKQLSVPEVADALHVEPQHLYEMMRRHEVARRSRSESNFLVNRDKPQFCWRRDLTPDEKRLQTAGLMLYWAEGAKQGHRVDLANTDPKLVLVFLRFLREICGVAESRLRALLYVYEGQDVGAIRRYWSTLTQIPEAQFQKPYVSRYRTDRARQKILPYGVIHIRYSDTKLFQRLLASAQQEADTFISRADAGVANRDGL